MLQLSKEHLSHFPISHLQLSWKDLVDIKILSKEKLFSDWIQKFSECVANAQYLVWCRVLDKFVSVKQEIGLEVNADKTKYMIMSRDQNARTKLQYEDLQ